MRKPIHLTRDAERNIFDGETAERGFNQNVLLVLILVALVASCALAAWLDSASSLALLP